YRRDVLYSSRRRHTRSKRDWSSDVCSSDLPQAKFKFELPAKKAGVVTEIIANEIGKAALMLGAGRETQKSVIDLSVGIVLHKKIGDKVEQGETWLTIHTNKSSIDAIKDKLYQHINISNKEIPQPTLIHNTS